MKALKNESVVVMLGLTVLLLAGCASLAKNKAELAVSHKEFETYSTASESIDGMNIKKDFLLYKKYNGFDGTIEAVYITAAYPASTPEKITYTVDVNYQGTGWKFIQDFNIRTDSDVFKMTTNSYNRDTYIVANQARCLEQTFFQLSSEKIENILNTNTLVIQYTTSQVIHIKPEGLDKLKNFFSQK